jgi:RHS repeat-associated protein
LYFHALSGIFYYRTQEQAVAAGTTFVEDGMDFSSGPPPPNQRCPYWWGASGYQCDTFWLQAFYVTAVGATGGEGPRSNVVFWDCITGYARQRRPSPQLEEAIAKATASGASGGEFQLDGAAFMPEVDAFQLAPPLVLGQAASNPPWRLFDLHTDHLGSVRLVTNDLKQVVSRHDFFPYGEEVETGITYNTHAFTGHDQDQATGLDYMAARYYGSSFARFISADPIFGTRLVPSTLNRYAYVLGNPLSLIDPSGLYGVDPDPSDGFQDPCSGKGPLCQSAAGSGSGSNVSGQDEAKKKGFWRRVFDFFFGSDNGEESDRAAQARELEAQGHIDSETSRSQDSRVIEDAAKDALSEVGGATIEGLAQAFAAPVLTSRMLSTAAKIAEGRKIMKIKELVAKFGGDEKGWKKLKTFDAAGREVHYYYHRDVGKVGAKYKGEPDPF